MRSCGAYASIPYLPEHYDCEPSPGGSIPGCIDELPIQIPILLATGAVVDTNWQAKEPGQRIVDLVFEDRATATDLTFIDVVDITDYNRKSMRRNFSSDTQNVADRLARASAQSRENFAGFGAGVGQSTTTLGKIPFPAWKGSSSDVQTISLRNNDATADKPLVDFSVVFYTPDGKDTAAWSKSNGGHAKVPSGMPAAVP